MGDKDVLKPLVPCFLEGGGSVREVVGSRGLKWESYQGIVSLLDYVVVSQAEPRIEHFRRDADSGTWVYRATGSGGQVRLTNGAVLDVDGIFHGALDLPGD